MQLYCIKDFAFFLKCRHRSAIKAANNLYFSFMEQIMLDVQGLVKRYAAHTALDGVSIQVPKGSIFGLLGPNGAGKTTLIRTINQIIQPDQGSILLDGEKLKPAHIARIGYLPEERGLYRKMKVGEQALYLARLKGLSTEQAKKNLSYWFEKFDLNSWWNKKVEELSKGMQQKVQFIVTVLHQPDFLILDEPFSGFDPVNAQLIRDEILALRNQGTTIMLSTHRMESVETMCDHLALIHKAKVLLEGSVQGLKEQYRSHTYAIQVELHDKNATCPLPQSIGTLIREERNENSVTWTCHLPDPEKLNQAWPVFMELGSLRQVQEIIPSMNDIFIQTVNGNSPL